MSYQAVYDAVRASLRDTSIGAAVENVMREANLGDYARMTAERAAYAAEEAMREQTRPSVLYRANLVRTTNGWAATFGNNTTIWATGDTPAAAMRAFDLAWTRKDEPTGYAALS